MKESGYDGRPIVILHVTDIAHQNGAAVVTCRRLESIGFNVDDKAMDWSTNLTMRARKEPPSKGGWNIMHSWIDAVEAMNPVVNPQLSIADIPQIEKLVTDWVRATDQRKRKAIADEIQKVALSEVAYAPVGRMADANGLSKQRPRHPKIQCATLLERAEDVERAMSVEHRSGADRGSHSLARGCSPRRSPHSYFGEATCGGEYRAGRRALLFTLKKLRGRT